MKRLLENASKFFERITGGTVESPPVAPPAAPPKPVQPPAMFSVFSNDKEHEALNRESFQKKLRERADYERYQAEVNAALQSKEPAPTQATPPPQRTNILKALLNRNSPEEQKVEEPKVKKEPAPPDEPLFGSKFLQGLGNNPDFDDSDLEDDSTDSELEYENMTMIGEIEAKEPSLKEDKPVLNAPINEDNDNADSSDQEIPVMVESDEDDESNEEEHENKVAAKSEDRPVIPKAKNIKDMLAETLNDLESAKTEEEKVASAKTPEQKQQDTADLADQLIAEFEQHGQNKIDAKRDTDIQLRSKLHDEINNFNPNTNSRAALKEGIASLKTSGVYDQLKIRGNKMGDKDAKIAIDKIDRLDTLLKRIESKIVPPQGKSMMAKQISHLVSDMKADNKTITQLEKNIPKVEPREHTTASFNRR